MRILMIHNRYGASARGGAERVIERLVASFAAQGHACVVAVPGAGMRQQVSEADASVSVRSFAAPNVASLDRLGALPAPVRAAWHAIDLMQVVAARSLRQLLLAVQPDIVHTHNIVGCGGSTFEVIRAAGIPHVHTLHDVQLLTPSGLWVRGAPPTTWERSWAGRAYRALRRRRMGSPSVITGPTEWIIAEHDRYGFFPRSDAAVIGNPIMGMARQLPERRGCIRTLLFVGQLEGHKGVVTLLEAYRRLREDIPELALHVVGDGALLAMCKKFARTTRGVVIRGRLDAVGVALAIEEADMVVVPSLCAENQPSVILEACAAGVPVIATRVGGIPEMVREGETGFLVDPGNVDDLVRAVRAGVDDVPRVRSMADACRRLARAHDQETIARQFFAVYTHAARIQGGE
ncbi:glycosyltransferase [Candidatus Uhrbacteria bacterium]|nr:glycosyltransferase [Candidatus Uhrbacteria bacterium]